MIKKRYVLLGVFVYCLGFVDGKYQSFLYGTIKSVYESTGLPVPGRRTISKIPVKYNNIHTEKEIKGFI